MFESRRVAVRGPLSPGLRFALVGVVAAIGLAGCASSPISSTDTGAATANTNPTVVPSATPALSPTTPPPLSSIATGSMHTARGGATATLLKNGKVLFAGGGKRQGGTDIVYSSAELYDPATGKFSATGSMNSARFYATATLLPDGRVLIAGGEGCSNRRSCDVASNSLQHLASAELYDPATGKFTATGSMTEASEQDTAMQLPDGRVMLTGWDQWAEIYDPSSGKFVRTPKNAAFQAAAVLLPNGKILLAGSQYGANPNAGGIYDFASGKFATVSLAPPPGTKPVQYNGVTISRPVPSTATLLNDGRVLLFEGGYLETYDPASGACADAGFISPAGAWVYPTATLMADGRVLFEGGYLVDPATDEYTTTNTAVLYDPTGGPSRTGSANANRVWQTATLLPDGSVLIAGGEDAAGDPLASAELFKP
jgi:hypothetical protein